MIAARIGQLPIFVLETSEILICVDFFGSLFVSLFVSSSQALQRRKSVIGVFMIDVLELATSCNDIRFVECEETFLGQSTEVFSLKR